MSDANQQIHGGGDLGNDYNLKTVIYNFIGRSGGIRTHDPLSPRQVR